MSASEKLKALDAETNGNPGPDLVDALPALIAVVEAAEHAWPPPHNLGMTSNELFNRAHAALAALDEALGES